MLGVKFDDIHTQKDLGMYLFSKSIGSPEVKSNKVDLVGADGSIDLTSAISDKPLYKNRKLSFTFGVLNPKTSWAKKYSDVLNKIHGRNMRVILDDDKSYYYTGLISVNEWKSDKTHGEIVVDCDVEPYKKKLSASDEPWLWDTFSFIDGIAQSSDYDVHIMRDVLILVQGSEVIPEFISDSNMQIVYDGKSYQIGAETKKFYDLRLQAGLNSLRFMGNGNIKVRFREEML